MPLPPTSADSPLVGDSVHQLVLPSSGELLGNWYEASAYGDHVPKELPKLMVAFLAEFGATITEDIAWEIISESTPDDSWIKLFECIFAEGAEYTMQTLANRALLRENSQISDR